MTVSVAVGLPPNLKGVKASGAALSNRHQLVPRKEQMVRFLGNTGALPTGAGAVMRPFLYVAH